MGPAGRVSDVEREHAGAELWLVAGARLLEQGGVAAVKLPALAATVGLTTGSFYHHFRNMPEFLDRLAARYAGPSAGIALGVPADPRERIRAAVRLQSGDDRRSVGFALRDWASTSEAAKQAVHESDTTVLERLTDDFEAVGFDRDQARARALVVFSVGVAKVHAPWGGDVPDLDAALEVLARRPS